MTSKRSIQEISDLLQFGTRNYFSKVFHEVVGMTPAAYRTGQGRKMSAESSDGYGDANGIRNAVDGEGGEL